MSGAKTLTVGEIRLIKRMLALNPPLNNQQILAHFTRPGRDINHRVIAQIKGGSHSNLAPATLAEAHAYMAAAGTIIRPSPDKFVQGGVQGTAFELILDWWPVGQGLFATGIIRRFGRGSSIGWVFDCGTTSTKSLLDDAIMFYGDRRDHCGPDRLNLVTISHFDRDHISGFVALLRGQVVELVLLPYVPLWQRLMIAIENRIGATDEIFGFFVDPAGFLSGLEGSEIQRVVFVPSVDGEGPKPQPPDAPIDGPVDVGDGNLKPELGQPPDEVSDDLGLTAGSDPRVSFLAEAGRIVVPTFWEFVPYNDARMLPRVTSAFLSKVAPILDRFRTDHANRVTALDDLKAAYDQNFGSFSRPRNLISLSLYSGPLGVRQSCLRFGRLILLALGTRQTDFPNCTLGICFSTVPRDVTAFCSSSAT
ncbi:hypothetical protein BHAOGJBA_1651 [Methylobacterium hispanicum]|uniref:Metallo-beta-lactamase domain-containing protein n=1 Tax=Methylobacterium hispanicum TaxID=270350 RepID=A0AAV4ZIX8_9HYPH|nr:MULTISPECIES: hypothetical protein [Methylobacterium]GJD88138.1 hypothetical protein BHAOGJBA_1651 [Methylobacterium hispanicum]